MQADIYTFVDEQGMVHFTNVPSDPRSEPVSWQKVRSRRPSPAQLRRYTGYIETAGRRFRVDPLLVKAVISAESAFDCLAVSCKGAQGLMQLMPGTAADLRVADPFDPKENIHGGTRYLRALLDRFDGDLRLTLAAYNAGPTRVEEAGTVPAIPETTQYVAKVLKKYRQLQTTAFRTTGKDASSTLYR